MLPKFIIPSILLAASLNGVTAAPLEDSGIEAKRDELGNIISGIISAAVTDVGTSAIAEVTGAIESLVDGATATMSATEITDPGPVETATSILPAGPQTTVVALSVTSSTGAVVFTSAATGVLTLPGGGLWTPFSVVADSTTDVSVNPSAGTIALDSSAISVDADTETIFLTSATAPIVTATAVATVTALSAGIAGVVSALPDIAVGPDSSASPLPTPPSKRGDNILSEIFGGELATLANEVMSVLPSKDAAHVSSVADELLGSSSSATGAGAATGTSSSTSTSTSSTATHTNAALAGRVSLSQTSFAGAAVVFCSILFGSMIGI